MTNDSRTRRGRLRRTILLVSAAALAVSGIVPAAGASDQPAQVSQFERLDLEELGLAEIDLGDFTPRYLQGDRTVHVMVELEGRPIALERAAARDRGGELSDARERGLERALERQQERLLGPLRSLGASVESQLQHAYNGMRIRVPASSIDDIAALQGVRAVRALEVHELLNATSANHLGIPEHLWSDLSVTGEGVSVAIIDTGIDYTHANFGGEGTPDAFEDNDPTSIDDGTFPTAKVVGGYDFVGDDYNASSDDREVSTPQPDDDPIDCNGHGTHVAGTVGGFGVENGETYAGAYAGLDPSGMDIGPGMAPDVELYALKVFGCAGSTAVTVDAINWAVKKKVDVINMSLGSLFGRATDPSAVASTNAVEAGIVVVASAGNSGDVRYITGSPASSDGAISVAAMDTAFETIPMAAMARVQMQVSNGAEIPDGEITANVHVLHDDPETTADESLGCQLTDYAGIAAGDIVITFRGVCARVDRAIHGEKAGASAVVMVNSDASLPPFEGTIPGVTIPFLGARSTAAGTLSGLDGTVETLSSIEPVANEAYEHFAEFTSAGPRNADGASKPDLTAPGVAVDSSLVGTGSGNARFSGTSMAAPVVAGVAALVAENQPDWDAEQVKGAIVNSGSPDGVLDYRTTLGGSGVVTPERAVTADVVALGDPLTASLSFGVLSGTDEDTFTKSVSLHGASATLDVSVEWSESVDGVRLTTPLEPVSVEVGTFDVDLDVDWSEVASYATASGTILLSDADHELRVPFVAVLDPVSSIDTEVVDMPRRNGTTTFRSTNDSTVPGTLDVFAWMLEDAEGDTFGTSEPKIDSPVDIRAVGVQSFPDAFGAGASLAVVAINSHHPTSTAIVNEYDVLWDVDQDGTPDYVTVGIDYGLVLGLGFIDFPVSLTFDLATGALVDGWAAVVDYDSSTILLPFMPENLGLSAGGDTEIGLYGVATYSLEGYGDDWASAPRSVIDLYGASSPLEVGQYAELGGGETIEWSATINRSNQAKGVLGWMLVTTGDEAGAAEADLIPLDTGPRGGPRGGPGGRGPGGDGPPVGRP